MKCNVIKQFSRKGVSQLPGTVIEIPEDIFPKLSGYVQPIATADTYPSDWRPEFKVWLTPEGDLRSTGVCDDLAGEIVRLTADDMELQAKLLRLHDGRYSPPYWINTIRQWRERARVLFEVEGLGLHEANWQAAGEMHLRAFADELMLKEPPK